MTSHVCVAVAAATRTGNFCLYHILLLLIIPDTTDTSQQWLEPKLRMYALLKQISFFFFFFFNLHTYGSYCGNVWLSFLHLFVPRHCILLLFKKAIMSTINYFYFFCKLCDVFDTWNTCFNENIQSQILLLATWLAGSHKSQAQSSILTVWMLRVIVCVWVHVFLRASEPPGISHHENKVSVAVNGCTDTTVIVDKLFFGHL